MRRLLSPYRMAWLLAAAGMFACGRYATHTDWRGLLWLPELVAVCLVAGLGTKDADILRETPPVPPHVAGDGAGSVSADVGTVSRSARRPRCSASRLTIPRDPR